MSEAQKEAREALDQIIRDADGYWPVARDAILALMDEASRAPQPTDDDHEELARVIATDMDTRVGQAVVLTEQDYLLADAILGSDWLAVYTAEKQAEALELAAAAGAGYVVTAANRRYREGAEHADIYWKRALERAAQRLREQATNQRNGGQ